MPGKYLLHSHHGAYKEQIIKKHNMVAYTTAAYYAPFFFEGRYCCQMNEYLSATSVQAHKGMTKYSICED